MCFSMAAWSYWSPPRASPLHLFEPSLSSGGKWYADTRFFTSAMFPVEVRGVADEQVAIGMSCGPWPSSPRRGSGLSYVAWTKASRSSSVTPPWSRGLRVQKVSTSRNVVEAELYGRTASDPNYPPLEVANPAGRAVEAVRLPCMRERVRFPPGGRAGSTAPLR